MSATRTSTLELLRAARAANPTESPEAMVLKDRILDLGYSAERARQACYADRLDALEALVTDDKPLHKLREIREIAISKHTNPTRLHGQILRYLRARVVTAAIEDYERGTASRRHYDAILPARHVRDAAKERVITHAAQRTRYSREAVKRSVESCGIVAERFRWGPSKHFDWLVSIASGVSFVTAFGNELHNEIERLYRASCLDTATGADLDDWAELIL